MTTATTKPTNDQKRKSFGRCRTKCSCRECSRPCEFMPGMLAPEDLTTIYEATKEPGEHYFDWVTRSLLASPGALVGIVSTGQTWRIPTIVPARQPGTSKCIYLSDDGKCKIHEISPYGCAFADSHMTQEEGDAVSRIGLRMIADAMHTTGRYTLTLATLHGGGYIAPGPEVSRAAMAEAAKKELSNGS